MDIIFLNEIQLGTEELETFNYPVETTLGFFSDKGCSHLSNQNKISCFALLMILLKGFKLVDL